MMAEGGGVRGLWRKLSLFHNSRSPGFALMLVLFTETKAHLSSASVKS
jgi:hypothetical protein